MPTVTFEDLRRKIRARDLATLYIIHGEEGYYADVLARDFEEALPEEDRVFNQHVLYAADIEPGAVMDLCARFPMGGDRQMVIVKECQTARADSINRFYKYFQNPTPSTTLVLIFRGADAKGKELMAAAKTSAVIFQSKKATDYTTPTLIRNYIKEKQMSADEKSVAMLHEYIGNNLGRLFNEIDKLAAILGQGGKITPETVERNIGISKDYNAFELIDAVAARDAAKVMRITQYFSSNTKAIATPVLTGMLFNFFSDLLICYYSKDKTEQGLMQALNAKSAFAVKRFRTGMSRYNAYQVIECINALRDFDAQSKGRGSRKNEWQLLHELMYHLLTAPGLLPV